MVFSNTNISERSNSLCTAQKATVRTRQHVSMPKNIIKSLTIMLLGMAFFVGGVNGQTNPTAFDLSTGSFTFSTQTATNTSYPTNMQGWTTGTNNIATLPTAAPGADQALVASGTASTSGLSNLGGSGFNFLTTSSSPNQQVGEICVALNTTNRINILVSWTAADQTSGSTRQMNMTLQYRVGTSGTFTTVGSSTYTSSNTAQASATNFSNVALPVACENQSVVQIRWVTYESASQSGGRDALRLDDITVSSSSNITNFYWNGGTTTGTGASTGGSGTWTVGGTNWRSPTDIAGSASTAWANSTSNIANLTAGSGTITMGTSITSGGLNVSTTGYTLAPNTTISVASPVTLTSSLTVAPSSGTFTMSGVISGAGGLTNTTGTTVLSGANTYTTGGTTLTSGTLQVGVASVGSVGSITSSAIGGGTLNLNGGIFSSSSTTAYSILNPYTIGGNVTIGDGTNTGALTFGAAGTISGASRTITTPSAVTLSGAIGDGGSAYGTTKAGSGTLTLGGSNTFTGGVTVNAGTLLLGNTGALNSTTPNAVTMGGGILSLNGNSVTVSSLSGASGTVNNNHASTATTLTVNTTGTPSYTGTLVDGSTAALALTKSGSGTLTLSSANTYTGATTISAGTIKLGTNNAIPTATALSVAGTLDLSGWNQTVGSLTGAGTIDNSLNFGLTFTVGNSSNTTFSGAIKNTTGTVPVVKQGSGTLTLTGANTYTGTTTVSAGTLQLNRTGGATLSSSTATTISGGTLQISSNQTLSSLTLSSGNLTIDASTTLTISGTFAFNGGTITNNGTLIVNGVTIGAGVGNTVILPGAVTFNTSGSLTITTGTLSVTGTVTDNGFTSYTGTSGFLSFAAASSFISNYGGSSVVIPSAVWNTTSTCTVQGVTTTMPIGLGQTFGNFIWSSANQSAFLAFNNASFSTAGTFTVTNTGNGTKGLYLINDATNRSYTFNALTINGGYLYMTFPGSGTAGIATVGVTNALTVSSGQLSFGYDNSNSGNTLNGYTSTGNNYVYSGTINLGGNLNITGGTVTGNTGFWFWYGAINFTSGSHTVVSATSNSFVDFYVLNGATVTLGTDVTLSSTSAARLNGFFVNSGGTLNTSTYRILDAGGFTTFQAYSGSTIITSNAAGIAASGATGAIQTATRGFNGAANFEFDGASTGNFQTTLVSTINGNTVYSVNNLTINNASGITAAQNLLVNGTLGMTTGILTTSTSNMVYVGNSSASAITGYTSSNYISGPLARTFASSLSSGTTYVFPIGKGGSYLPFSINPVTGGTVPVIQVEAAKASVVAAGATVDASMQSLNTSEYWNTSVLSGSFTSGILSATGLTTIATGYTLASSATLGGVYTTINGTASTPSVNNSSSVSSLGYYAIGLKSAPVVSPAVSATVDGAFTATFTDDATWRAAVTSITVGGTTLTAGYSISAGQIVFTPSASSPANLLQTSGSKTIAVIATGYPNSTFTQAIGVGAASATQSTLTPTAPSITVGGTQVLTVTAKDQYANTLTTGGATVTITQSGGTGTIGSVTDNSNGTYTATVTAPTTTGTGTFVSTLGGSAVKSGTASQITSTVTYVAGTATKLVITGTGTQTAGAAQTITITAQDANGNTATTYTGSKSLTFSGANSSTSPVTAPTVTNASSSAISFGSTTSITFTNGVGTGSMVLYKAESATISATDGTINATANTLAVTVSAGVATKLAITSTAISTTTGTPSSIITIQRQDAYGNPNTTDATRTVTLASSSTGAVTFNPVSPVTIANGSSSTTFTYTDTKVGTPTITCASTTPSTISSGTQVEAITVGAFTKLQILLPGETASAGSATGKTSSPTAQSKGTAFNVIVNAVDANWNVVNTVTDVVSFTSSDGAATLPTNTALVAGTKTFTSGVTLNTVGSFTVTTSDFTDNTKTANTSASVSVAISYCTPTVSTSTDGISNFSFNGINNTTTATNAYTDYSSAQITNLYAGVSYKATITVNTKGNYTNYQKIWIDWNNDGTFNTTAGSSGGLGEEYTLSNVTNSSAGYVSLTITVPTGATLGTSRMRVMSSYSSAKTSCATSVYGEYEDYGITILAQPLISWSPTVSSTPVTINSNITGVAPSIGSGASLYAANDLTYGYSVYNFNQATSITPSSETKYVQFSAAPASGYNFTTTSVNVNLIYSTYTSGKTDKFDVYYSTDPTFATSTKLNTTTQSLTSTTYNSATADYESLYNITINSSNGTMPSSTASGSTLYFRLYLYNVAAGTTSTTADYINLTNFTINGTVTAPPTITTTIAATSITEAAASSGGQTLSGSVLTAKGVVWNTSTAPTVALSTKTNDGTSTTDYTSSLTSLSPQTLYYTRAYATNAAGTGYGNEITFRTLSNPVTAQASSLTATATTSNNIDLGWTAATFPGSGATTKGYLLYRATGANTPSFAGVNGAAPVAGSNTTLVTTLASSAVSYSNGSLSNTTTYNYLLIPFTWDGTNSATYNYLTASALTASATTLSPSTPTFNVGTIASFGAACLTAAPQMGSFTVSGASLTGASVSVSSTSTAYTFATSSSGPYSNPLDITAYISGSAQNIYVYFAPTTVGADNADITVSGGGVASPSVVSQTGNSGIDTKPSFTSATAGSISSTVATISVSLASIGCSAITDYGIKYSTSSSFDPTSVGTTLTGSNLSGTTFSVPITGLSPNQTYYYAAYATNHGGTTYSAVASSTPSFTTATPTISTSGSLSALSTTYGIASSTTTFNVSGVYLTASITITPPIGFEVATTSNFSTTIGTNSSPLVVGAAGTVSATPIYVRLAATTNAGSYSGNIVTTSSNATSKNIATVASTVNPKALTISGLTIPASKQYDGTTTASVTGSASLLSAESVGTGTTSDGKPFTGDDVSLSIGTLTGTYNSANVASATTVTIGGITLAGTAASNYTLTNTVNATISTLSLTLTASNQSKSFGSSSPTTGTLSTNFTISGLIGSDAVNVALAYSGSPSGNLATATAGTYTITPSITSFSVGASTNYGTPSITTGTLTISATVPGTPAITITSGSQQLTITVTSVSTGGTAITDYLYSTDGGTTYKSAGTASSPILITTVSTGSSSLANGTQYSVTVKAVNSIGTGTVSNSVNATPALANSSVNTWITTGNVTAWMTGANWVSGVIPSSTTVAQFDAQSGTSTTAGITFVSDFSIIGIELTSNRPRVLTIGGTGGASGPNYYNLTLTGGVIGSTVNTIIRNASSSLLTITPNNSGANYINLVLGNTTNNNINIDGSGGITIASAISGANPLTKGGSGSGVLILSGANTYTGTTTVSAGTLQLNRSGGTTIPTTNSIVINGGTLKISSNQTISNFTMTSGSLLIDAGVTLTISGSYSASGGTITNNGTIALTGISKTFPGNAVSFPTVSVAGQTLPYINNLTINLSSATNVITWSTPGATMVINGTLTLNSGLITTSITNNLSLVNPVTGLSGGSSSSYINGPMGIGFAANSITGTYPIGAGGNYRPVQFTYTGCGTCGASPNIAIIQQNEGIYPNGIPSNYSTSRFGSRYYSIIQNPAAYPFTMKIDNNGGTALGSAKALFWEGGATANSSVNSATATSTYYSFSATPLSTSNIFDTTELVETSIPLTIASAVTANKVYDGTTTASVSGATLSGLVSGDNVTLVPVYNFSQSTPGTSLAITSTSSITGTNAAAYTLTQPSLTARDITAGTVGSWLGVVSTDYNNVANWQSYSVPLSASNVTIPASGITNYPVLSGATTVNNLAINSGTLNLNGQALTINGAISGAGTITPTAASSLIIGGTVGVINFTSGSNTIKDLTLNSSATATLGGITNITAGATPGTVSIASGATLNTGGNLVIKSDALGTARIAQGSGSYLSGNVTVERYITAKAGRRFSFVGTSVTQSVRNAWQQQIYVTGSGTGGQPCGNTTGNGGNTDKYNSNGFDATITSANTILQYNAAVVKSSHYAGITNTGVSLTPGTGYSVNIRGNRNSATVTCDNQLNNTAPTAPEAVTLSATGAVTTGDLVVALNDKVVHNFTLLANPYPSQISFSAFKGDNSIINNKMWTFSPFGSGNFTTLSNGHIVNGASGYDDTYGNIIANGQAFFVEANANGNVTFSESHKTSGNLPNTQYFGVAPEKTMRIGFYNASTRLDEILLIYNKQGTKDYDPNWDAASMSLTSQALVAYKGSNKLAIAYFPDSTVADTTQLGVAIKAGSYSLIFSQLETIDSLQTITLMDKFLGTTTDIRSNPTYNFNVTTDTASKGANRFKVVLSGAVPLAVNFVGISATPNANGVAVKWSVANEAKIASYSVERSTDGAHFASVNNSKATGATAYSIQDGNLPASANTMYYRVKATDNLGKTTYTNVVVLTIHDSRFTGLSIFPNPVQHKLNLTLTGATSGSLYSVKITTATGKFVFTKADVPVTGNAITFDASSFAAGVYMIELTDAKGDKLVSKFVKE